MTRPHYTYTYFNCMRLGEAARLIFAHANVDYERVDVDLTNESDWAELKPTLPFGQLPVLEVDGKQLHQSIAICRYLGKKFGLLADDDWNNAHADATALTILDLIVAAAKFHYETDEVRKKELENKFETETLPYYYSRFNAILKKYGGHLAGKLTWVDFYVTGGIGCLDGMLKRKTTEKYPYLKKLVDSIFDLPNVKEYIATRPFNPDKDF